MGESIMRVRLTYGGGSGDYRLLEQRRQRVPRVGAGQDLPVYFVLAVKAAKTNMHVE